MCFNNVDYQDTNLKLLNILYNHPLELMRTNVLVCDIYTCLTVCHNGTSHNHLDFVVVIFLARDKIDISPKCLFKIKFWLHYMYNFVKIDKYQDNVW